MQHGHCSRYMEALRLGREAKITRGERGSGVEGDGPGPASQNRQNQSFWEDFGWLAAKKTVLFVHVPIYIVAIPVHECLYWGFCARYTTDRRCPSTPHEQGMNADQTREISRYLSQQTQSVQDRKYLLLMGRKKGSLSNTPHPLCFYIGGTLVITYSHCVSPEWLCKRGFVPSKKNSLTGAD